MVVGYCGGYDDDSPQQIAPPGWCPGYSDPSFWRRRWIDLHRRYDLSIGVGAVGRPTEQGSGGFSDVVENRRDHRQVTNQPLPAGPKRLERHCAAGAGLGSGYTNPATDPS